MKFFTITLLATLYVSQLFAQWLPDPAINNPVVLSANKGMAPINNMVSATDGNGGMFIVWTDNRNSGTTGFDIFITRILNTGNIAPGFLPGGNPVCTASRNQLNLSVTSDGIDGVIVSWTDRRSLPTNGGDIYAQRINGSGTALWTNNGVPVATSINDESTPVIELTSSNTVAVVWRNVMPGILGVDLMANFLDLSNGSKVHGTDITVVSQNNTQSNQQILRDGVGGFMIIWTDGRVSDNNQMLYAQRINTSGQLLWGPPGNEVDGQLIIGSAGDVIQPRITLDGEGGFVVAFASTRISATDANIYAQKVNFNGIPQWIVDGVPVCTAPSSQSDVRIVNSGASTYVIGWVDRRNSGNASLTSNRDIYTQALDQNGTPKWTPDGKVVVKLIRNQPISPEFGFSMLHDQLGGAYFIWDDSRVSGGNVNIYAQRVLTDGSDSWNTNGVAISINGSNQNWPMVVRSGDRLVIAWRDSRTANNAEIYASQVFSNGLLPVDILELTARPNGKNVLVEWTSKNESVLSHFEIERSTDGNSFNTAGKVSARNTAGTFRYSFEDLKPSAGNNFYRIKSVDIDGSFAYSNVARVSMIKISENKLLLYPNPAFTSVNIQMNNIPNGQYAVKIIDMQGKVILTQNVAIINSNQNVQIPVTRIAGGLYKVQVVNANGEHVGQQSLIKQ